MNHGRAPNKGFRFAIPVARALGDVMFYLSSPHYPVDFTISGDRYLGLVGLRLSEKIGAKIAEIEIQFTRTIDGIRGIPTGGPVSRELWLYSRYGRLRFFGITMTGIEEIDRRKIVFPRRMPDKAEECTGRSGTPLPAMTAAAENVNEDIALLRWLSRRCADIREGGGMNGIDPALLKTGSGSPGPGVDTAQPKDPLTSGSESKGKPSRKKAVRTPPPEPDSGENPSCMAADRINPETPEENPENATRKSEENPASGKLGVLEGDDPEKIPAMDNTTPENFVPEPAEPAESSKPTQSSPENPSPGMADLIDRK